MELLILADVKHYFFGITMFLVAIFLTLLVLVQRGRGGGLTGALGGMGGQSAFGSKAGDVFTRITIVAATLWIFLCVSAVWFLSKPTQRFAGPPSSGSGGTVKSGPDDKSPADDLPRDGGTDDSSSSGTSSTGKAGTSGTSGSTKPAETGTTTDAEANPDKSATEKSDPEKSDSEKSDTEKSGTPKDSGDDAAKKSSGDSANPEKPESDSSP